MYKKYFLNNLLVDCNGDVFKITDRFLILKNGEKGKIVNLIPSNYQIEFVFENTDKNMTIEEVRSHFVEQLEKLDENVWIDNIEDAKTIKEIISPEKNWRKRAYYGRNYDINAKKN